MAYSIGEFAKLSGIHPATLRAWQRRYGLLKPGRSEGGHRLYSDADIQQAFKILDWIKKGVPVGKINGLLDRPEQSFENNWLALQQKFIERLNQGKIESLHHLLYESGREYPKEDLVDQLLRPLRQKIAANVSVTITLREVLDGIIISYASFCLESDRKSIGENYLFSGWYMNDACEIWLEALKQTGNGKRIDILPHLSTMITPKLFADRHWVLITTEKLTTSRRAQIAEWQGCVKSLNLVFL